MIEENKVEEVITNATDQVEISETEERLIEEESLDKVNDEQKPVEELPKEEVKPVKVNNRDRNLRLIVKAKERLALENQKLLSEKNVLAKKIEDYEKNKEVESSDYFEEEDATSSKLYKKIAEMEKQQSDLINRMNEDRVKEAERRAKREFDSANDRIKKEYSDFADVVSRTNVSVLEELDEAVVKKIVAETNVYKKAVMTYDAIRRNNIYSASNDIADNREAIIKNIAKPTSASSLSKTVKNSDSVFAEIHSRDYQNQLRRELEESRNNL